jgi:phosphoribosylformimino-5-aminoimidazole carboxamide ribotide isomerase
LDILSPSIIGLSTESHHSQTAALARAVAIPVIASGGISSLADLRALKVSGAPLDGAISGRALYEGRIDIAAAVRLLAA